MDTDPKVLEERAYAFLSQEKYDDAFRLFLKAAEIYKSQKNHKQSTLCYASAASCWNIKSGEKTFYNSASSYEEAAREAETSGDFEYASLLYKYAAINYEKDMEFLNFSECFYRSKECHRKFLTYLFINPKRIHHLTKAREAKGIKALIRHLFSWLASISSYLIWGYGERPSRTFFSGMGVIFLSAILYALDHLAKNGIAYRPGFSDALYFSVVTFTTVGYGDITPVGFSKLIVVIESLCGLFVMPLLIISLSRKYLRV